MTQLGYRDLRVEAFVHATESLPAVEKAVRLFAPQARIEKSELGGHFGQSLVRLSALERDSAAAAVTMERVKAEVGRAIGARISRHIDEALTLHIRFDKQEAFAGRMRLERSRRSDVVKLAARPRLPRLSHEQARALVQGEFPRLALTEEE